MKTWAISLLASRSMSAFIPPAAGQNAGRVAAADAGRTGAEGCPAGTLASTALALASAAMLASCGPAVEGGNASSQVSKSAFTGPLRAGLYTVVQTGDAEEESERCITPAQVATQTFVTAHDVPEGWTVERNRVAGGEIDFEASGPSKGKILQKGSYTADSFTVEASLSFESSGEVLRLDNVQRGTFASADCGKAS